MKQLTIKITTHKDYQCEWNFTECKNEIDYGNGTYVVVDRDDDKFCIDVRYDLSYDFEITCVEYIKKYYGTYLKSYEVIRESNV